MLVLIAIRANNYEIIDDNIRLILKLRILVKSKNYYKLKV